MLSRRYFLAAVWCAAWVFWGVGLVWAEVRNPTGVAVIIGNKAYSHEQVPDVSYAHRDAEAFKRYVLEVLGFDPENVIDLRDANQGEMESVLGNKRQHEGRLWSYLDPCDGSDVVVFYSGHGVPGLRDKRGYLLPSNADPNTAEINGYPIEDLYGNLAKLEEARSVRVFLDACFSGGSEAGLLIHSASPVFTLFTLPEVPAKVTVLSAAENSQVASWDPQAGHGLFTHHLLDALYGKGDTDRDGKVMAGEVKKYLDRHMTKAARRRFGRLQNAELRGEEGVVLAAAPAGGFPERPELGVGKVRGDDKVTGDEIKGEGEGRTGKGSDPPQGYKQAMFLLGMKEAFEARDYSRVLEYGKELEAVGGALPDEAHHFLGVARFHEGRPGEARVALRSYVEKAGREGRYYEGSLKLLLAVKEKDDGAFAAAQSKNTVAGYGEYLSSWPGGRHRDEAERRKREQEDDAAFGEAKGADTGSAYEAYLSSYPRGRHAGEARSRRRELAEVERVEVSLELRREDRVMVQRGLESLGKAVGGADGVFGRRTRAGLRSWQKSKGLEETGYLTREQADALTAMGREVEEEAKERAEAERKAREQQAREEAARREREQREAARRREVERQVGRVFRDCGGCPEMVVVPAGSFEMGSPSSEEGRADDEGPVHRVTIRKVFAVGVREVTRGEYRRFVRATRHSAGDSCMTFEDGELKDRGGWNWEDPGYWQTDGHPVVCVSWEDAKGYVEWLSRETGEEYRLLSEAEWEYVARAGSRGARYWGGSEAGQCGHANGADKEAEKRYGNWTVVSCNDGHVHTAPVGSYGANGFGLQDVLGNVWEWAEDCWNGSYAGAPSDGSAWETGDCGRRVLRGGSWVNGPRFLRSAIRYWSSTGYRINLDGFRVARTLTP